MKNVVFDVYTTYHRNWKFTIYIVQVIHQKSRITYNDLTNDLCSVSLPLFLLLIICSCMIWLSIYMTFSLFFGNKQVTNFVSGFKYLSNSQNLHTLLGWQLPYSRRRCLSKNKTIKLVYHFAFMFCSWWPFITLLPVYRLLLPYTIK